MKDDREGDCSRAQCDGNGFIEHVYEPTHIGTQYTFECHEWRCEEIISLTARAAPTSIAKRDGSPCSLSDTGAPGVCELGTCVSEEMDSGIPDSDADADAGPLGDGAADATSDA